MLLSEIFPLILCYEIFVSCCLLVCDIWNNTVTTILSILELLMKLGACIQTSLEAASLLYVHPLVLYIG